MKKEKSSDFSQDETTLEDKKLSHFKSPPKENTPDTTKVGDDTPVNTNQSYAEDNVAANPLDKTKKRSLVSPKDFGGSDEDTQ